MGFVGSDLWKVRQKWGSGLILWPGVAMIVVNDVGQVLLGKRSDNGLWSLLGGYFELGDSAESAARREVREEIGLEPTHLRMIGVLTDAKFTTHTYAGGDTTQAPTFVFEVCVDGEPKIGDDEHTAFAWVALEEAVERFKGTGRSTEAYLQMFAKWRETGEFQVR